MSLDWHKLTPAEIDKFLKINQINDIYDIGEYIYTLANAANFQLELTPELEDLILANNYTKHIRLNSYSANDLRKMTADKAQTFAKVFGISPDDPNLIERIIRILKYKDALKK